MKSWALSVNYEFPTLKLAACAQLIKKFKELIANFPWVGNKTGLMNCAPQKKKPENISLNSF